MKFIYLNFALTKIGFFDFASKVEATAAALWRRLLSIFHLGKWRASPARALACPETISGAAGRLEAVQYLDLSDVRALAARQQLHGRRARRAAQITV